jgi:glycosyltransferase involved in cell wall biosynthesis
VELVYLANARLPTEKAHGLQIVKMCEAFAQAGASIELVVPRRANTPQMQDVGDLWAYYDLTSRFALISLPCLDWPWLAHVGLEPFWFRWIEYTFGLSVLWFLIQRPRRKRDLILYTRDEYLGPWLLRLKQRLGLRVFFEAHNIHSRSWARRFRDADGLVAITHGLRQEFVEVGLPPERCVVAPDGTDLSRFAALPDRAEARRQLNLLADEPIVCYTGQLFPWKGVYTLVESAGQLPEAQFVIVGGIPEDVQALRSFAASHQVTNVQFVGHVPPTEVPLYQAAADVLVLPNSGREAISARYSSPLKLFEYMAAGRPIVASGLPSIREILTDGLDALLVEPDDPDALANGIGRILSSAELATSLGMAAQRKVADFTWQKRAQEILDFIAVQADGLVSISRGKGNGSATH